MNNPIDACYTKKELLGIVDKMRAVSDTFYGMAIFCNNHAFVEFCGFMNKYISLCERAALAGIDFTQANTHSGGSLPVEDHDIGYIARSSTASLAHAIDESRARRVPEAYRVGRRLHGETVSIPKETDIQESTRILKSAIRGIIPGGPYEKIKLKCFNKNEADEISALLTEGERNLVIFTWLEFGKKT